MIIGQGQKISYCHHFYLHQFYESIPIPPPVSEDLGVKMLYICSPNPPLFLTLNDNVITCSNLAYRYLRVRVNVFRQQVGKRKYHYFIGQSGSGLWKKISLNFMSLNLISLIGRVDVTLLSLFFNSSLSLNTVGSEQQPAFTVIS